MNAFLILNEGAGSHAAGNDPPVPSSVIDAFQSAGIPVQLRVASTDKLEVAIQAAAQERADVIFVGGGDGSLSTAAHCLVDTGIALGVVPTGTFNHFARDLGLSLNWRETVEALARAEYRNVDVGEVNGRIFINNCSIGSYAEAVRKRDALRRMRGLAKWWAMMLATFAVLRRLRRLRITIEVNGSAIALRAPFVVVANNRYSGRIFDYNLRSCLDEGRLWIYTTRAHRHGAVLRSICQSLLRRIDQVDTLEKLETTAATMAYDYARLPIAIDGELVDLEPPLRFRTRPGALRVIVPRPSQIDSDETTR